MRILVLPAAVLLALCLYLPLPAAKPFIARQLTGLYETVRRLFTDKKGKTDGKSALAVYLLALAAAATLLGALHPAVAAVILAPLFSAFSLLPGCAKVKEDLDSGKYARDRESYELQVILACEPLGDAFAKELITPMLLIAVGMPLQLGCALGWVYAGLCAAQALSPGVCRVLAPIRRAGEAVTLFFLQLCSCVVGHNPLRTGGQGASQRLLFILGLAHRSEEEAHAPMAGDITQGVFVCCFGAALLCLALTAVGFFLI